MKENGQLGLKSNLIFCLEYYHRCKDDNDHDHLWPRWMHDKKVSVDGDQKDGEGGEEDAGGLGGAHQLAQHLLKRSFRM